MIISLGGEAGSGKSTVSRLLAKKLNLKHYSMGDLRKKAAENRGMTMAEYNQLGEEDPSTDKDVDNLQKNLAKEDNFVIDGRLSWFFIPQSIKIYLTAAPKVRAERVFKDERVVERFATIEEAEKAILARDESDAYRYEKYYGLDCNDQNQYDLVIDTTYAPAEEVANQILDFLKK